MFFFLQISFTLYSSLQFKSYFLLKCVPVLQISKCTPQTANTTSCKIWFTRYKSRKEKGTLLAAKNIIEHFFFFLMLPYSFYLTFVSYSLGNFIHSFFVSLSIYFFKFLFLPFSFLILSFFLSFFRSFILYVLLSFFLFFLLTQIFFIIPCMHLGFFLLFFLSFRFLLSNLHFLLYFFLLVLFSFLVSISYFI